MLHIKSPNKGLQYAAEPGVKRRVQPHMRYS